MRTKVSNIGGQKNINAFVEYKLGLLADGDKSMLSLYRLMFSEKENIFFEETDGFRIKKMTYGEAYAEIESRAADMHNKIGEENQSVVGLYMDNSARWIIAFWAIIRAGYRPMLLNKRFDDDAIEKLIADFNVVAVISDGKRFSVKTFLFDEIQKNECDVDFTAGEEMYVTSSGTSSVKICAYSSQELINIISNTRDLLKKNKAIKAHYDGQLKLLTLLPFYHIFGFVAVYLWFGFFSRTFVKLNDLSPDTVLNTVKKHKVTHIFGVPLFWDTVYFKARSAIKRRGEKLWNKFLKGMSISKKLGNSAIGRLFVKKAFREVRDEMFGDSIKFMITGGSAINQDVLEFFNGIGYRLVNGFGMSEIGITSVELSDSRKVITSGSVGKPFMTVDYRLNDGILYVKGTSVAKYIIEKGEKKVIGADWFRTGDLAEEKNGRYYLCGRSDDLIVSVTGENLNPVAIEEKLFPKDALQVCLIAGRNESLPVLIVSVAKTTSQKEWEKIKDEIKTLAEKNNLTAQIGKIYPVKQSLLGEKDFKPNRKKIAEKYYAGELETLTFTKNSAELDGLTEKVRSYFAVALNKNAEEIAVDSDFFLDEGGTSLDYFAMITSLREEFPVPFPEDGSGESMNTVEKIAEYIKSVS